jgi:hypothetical protein
VGDSLRWAAAHPARCYCGYCSSGIGSTVRPVGSTTRAGPPPGQRWAPPSAQQVSTKEQRTRPDARMMICRLSLHLAEHGPRRPRRAEHSLSTAVSSEPGGSAIRKLLVASRGTAVDRLDRNRQAGRFDRRGSVEAGDAALLRRRIPSGLLRRTRARLQRVGRWPPSRCGAPPDPRRQRG